MKMKMKTKLTLKDIKIMLDNDINVCTCDGKYRVLWTIPHVYVPYNPKGNFRENLITLLKKLGYAYTEDTFYWAYDCNVLIFETDEDIADDVSKLRDEYDKKLLIVGGVIVW